MDSPSIFSQPSFSMDWSQTNLAILPEEKIYDIFSHLSVVDLRARTVSVCRQWQRISAEYLEKAESQEYQETRETIKYIIEYPWVNKNYSSIVQSLKKVLDKNKDEIKSSFALKRQAAEALEKWLAVDYFNDYDILVLDPVIGKRAKNLGEISLYGSKFKQLRETGECSVVHESDVSYGSPKNNFEIFYDICLKLINLSNFDMASKCALEIKSDEIKFRQEAQGFQQSAFAKIAQALTKQGYFGSACEIANKNMYPDSPDRNSRYKSYVWASISLGLEELNYNMPEQPRNSNSRYSRRKH